VSGIVTLLADAGPSATPYLVGMVLGFLVGSFGHLVKSRGLILLGIALLGVTVGLFMLKGLQSG
jgi:hypothetical protein